VTGGEINWRPGATPETLKIRAQLLQRTRAFFDLRNVLEVETPALSGAGTTELHLSSWQVTSSLRTDPQFFLHTSPELAMKRLLAAGSGDIYQICKVFRQGEQGHRHNPEFTLLEWYRTGFDMQAMMDEVDALLTGLLKNKITVKSEVLSYQQAFVKYAQCDPFNASTEQLKQIFTDYTQQDVQGIGEDDWLDLVVSQVVEPQLPRDRLVFITHYPASQASLAKLNIDDPRMAERFEVFAGGLELANGFHELTDVKEQRQRIEQENKQRQENGLPIMEVDERFFAALEHGLPDCSGVAIGFDRVVMLAAGVDDIRKVISFSFDKA